MGQFFKFVFASCLGVFLSLLLVGIITTSIIAGLASSFDDSVETVKPNSILHLKFNKPIPERTNNLPLDPFSIKDTRILGLTEIIAALEKAKTDDNIKGVLIETDGIMGGMATADAIRTAIEELKQSGKFVYAYANAYTQGAYYVASAADKVYLNPLGLVDFRGFAAQIPFLKDMLDKLGVEMQIFYAGKFKSATEPFRRREMSEENRLQVREYLDDTFAEFLSDISRGRNIPVDQLHRIADGYLAFMPQNALDLRIVDELSHRDKVIEDIRAKLGLKKSEKYPLVSLESYRRSKPGSSNLKATDKIAVVYAEGNIVDGKGEPGSIGGEKYADIIANIRKDDKVKAIVLRINSGGGSAMASENILRELELAQQQGIKLVVSMGDLAASGGYYIACKADSIFAEPNTLTGSIGVFSMIPNASGLLNDKIGIRFDTVKTGPFAHGISPFLKMSEDESRIMQGFVNHMYDTFLGHVASGRNMSKEAVNEIAQGRVWTGNKAIQIGLADRLGGLDEALQAAATLADVKEYRLTEYPRIKEPVEQLLDELMNMGDAQLQRTMRQQLGDMYPYFKFMRELQTGNGVQARLPFIIPFK